MTDFLYIDNHNVIEWQALTNSVTGVVDTGATVSATIKDSSGTEVSGQTWPAVMAHDTGGTYRATLDADLVLIPNRMYTALVEAVGSGGEIGHREIPVKGMTRNV